MKLQIFLLACFINTSCYSQGDTFRAKLFIEDSLEVGGGLIIFPLVKDTVSIDKNDTLVIVDLSISEHKTFYFLWSGWVSKIFRFDTNSVPSEIQRIHLPDTTFYKSFQQRHICPICFQSKYLIPVVYGMPLPKMLKMAEKNKIRLGGCVQGIETKFYCKKDEFEF